MVEVVGFGEEGVFEEVVLQLLLVLSCEVGAVVDRAEVGDGASHDLRHLDVVGMGLLHAPTLPFGTLNLSGEKLKPRSAVLPAFGGIPT